MSQHDYNIANGGGAAVRADINAALTAIQSLNSGATAPTATKPYMPWFDTTAGVMKFRNALDTDWVTGPQVDASGNVGIGTSSPTFKIQSHGATPAYFGIDATDGTRVGYADALPSNSLSCFVGWIPDSVGTSGVNGDLGLCPRTSAGANIRFFTGLTTATERARIDSSGNLLVGTTSQLSGQNFRQTIQTTAGQGTLALSDTANTSGFIYAGFYQTNTNIGVIARNGSTNAVQYVTTSDYRLKENVQPMTGALAKVAALKPCTYDWKEGGYKGQGFIAHELQEVVPDCVMGEKDAVDADGNPQYQGIDTSFLVATLTAAIQEQQTLITAMTARIDILEQGGV